jgi:hypothetical protein
MRILAYPAQAIHGEITTATVSEWQQIAEHSA